MTLQGNFLDYIFVFLGGAIISFTPCVYPLLPITVGYIGARSTGSKLRGFLLSLIYVTGIAITYSILGLIAALTGKLFGQIAAHPISHFIAGGIFIFFGLVLLDVFNLSVPRVPLQNKIKVKGFLSVFLLGLVSGLVVGPCTAPALGAILVHIGSRQNIIYGMSLMFAFAYGVGTVLILAGTFSGILINLPKSGSWLIKVKKACGIILILAGVYFLIKARSLML